MEGLSRQQSTEGKDRPVTSDPRQPPAGESNEATSEQLDVSAEQGQAYATALQAMEEESGARRQQAGEYLLAFVQEEAEGMYGLVDGDLVWHEAPEEANAHFEVAVADATDGRFVPGLDVTLTLLRDGEALFSTPMPFLWHPFLYHYGRNAQVPDEGPFSVHVRIEPAGFMRHDPVNGKRYGQPSRPPSTTFASSPAANPARPPLPGASPRRAPHPGTVAGGDWTLTRNVAARTKAVTGPGGVYVPHPQAPVPFPH